MSSKVNPNVSGMQKYAKMATKIPNTENNQNSPYKPMDSSRLGVNLLVKNNEINPIALNNPVPMALKFEGSSSPDKAKATGVIPPENPVYIDKIATIGNHCVKG